MKKLLVACQVVVLTLLTAPAAGAAPGGNSEWAKQCRTEYSALGFRNVGQCVSSHGRGGVVVPGPASLTLTFGAVPCASTPNQMCLWSVQGTGLAPGSQVVVGEAAVTYGASVAVDSAGNVPSHGIYLLGACVTAGFEQQAFIARGVAADGTPVASEVVVGNLLLHLQPC